MELQHHGTHKNNIIVKAENVGLYNFAIVYKLKERLNFNNIILRNDAKCAALCEKEYGSLIHYDDCIFFCLGTGIGRSCIYKWNYAKI